jgi:hypothetical protein
LSPRHGGPERRATLRERLGADPYPAWRMGHVLRAWRAADQVLRRSRDSAARRAHERAVAAALPALERLDSVEALLAHHAADRHRRATDAGPAPPGTVEAWLDAACRRGSPRGRPMLERHLVEGAAFWRRACALLGVPCD